MRVYQIADLHIEVDNYVDYYKAKIESLCAFIRKTQPKEEIFVIAVLGDIIDRGNPDSFKVAEIVFDYLLCRLDGFSFSIEFIPGNHDICNRSLNDFDAFILKYQQLTWRYTDSNAFAINHDGVNFIYTNSLTHLIFDKPGCLDWGSIQGLIQNNFQNILFLHHSFLLEDENNHSDIEHSFTIAQSLVDAGVKFVFHAHTHAGREYLLNSISLIGCGALIKNIKDMENINNQFNVIQIKNGEIINIEQQVFIGDHNQYISLPLYPKNDIEYSDPLKIKKIQYKAVDSYIKRKVLPHSVAIGDKWEQIFEKEKSSTLYEACCKNKNVLLLSDAGMGKSLELQQLAYELSHPESLYHPFLKLLEDYDGEDIKALLPQKYRGLYSGHLFLIFDGYDELNKELRTKFERKLRIYINENPGIHILVSARSNFCKIELDDKSKTLSNFKVFDLCKLTCTDINKYIKSIKVDLGNFQNEIERNSLYDLVDVPFYLVHMVGIYKKDVQLPLRSELMDRLIDLQLERDDSKFKDIGDFTIEERKHEIKLTLQKIAFALQLMQKIALNDENEYQAIFSSEQQNLAKYCGIFTRVKNNRKFLHNNFREYLAAELMKNMPLDIILKYIAYDDCTIKENWVNTLSYLALGHKSEDLLNWLAEYNPNALVRFEKDRVDENKIYHIFVSIFNNYESKNMWFHDPLCDEKQLVLFAASQKTLLFLLNKIQQPVHFRSQYTALMMLREFTGLFGMDEQVKNILIACCNNSTTRGHECRVAIASLALLQLDSKEITACLVKQFEASQDDYIRLGMYEYLIQTNSLDEYADFLVSGMELISYHRNGRVGNEAFKLVESLKNLTRIDSVKKVLCWFRKKVQNPFFQAEKVYEALCVTAARLYSEGETGLFDFMLNNFYAAEKSYNNYQCKLIISFFTKTKTKKQVINRIFTQDKNYEFCRYCIFDLFPEDIESLDYLAELYLKDNLADDKLFIDVLQCIMWPPEKFAEYSKMIFDKNGYVVPERKIIDYEAIRRAGQQAFFNTLFDKDQSVSLLHELLSFCGSENMTIMQLREADFPHEDNAEWEETRCLWFEIMRYGKSEEHAASFFDLISWNEYSDFAIMDYLKQYEWLNPNLKQLVYIEDRFQNLIREIDFTKAVTSHEDSCEVNLKAFFITYFFERYHFHISDEIKLDMLILPSFVFNSSGNNAKKYELLCSDLPQHIVSEHIKQNILLGIAQGETLEDHLEYCTQRQVYGVDEIAIKVCLNSKLRVYNKRTALDYLLAIKGEVYIYQNLMPDLDDDLLLEFAEIVWKNGSKELVSELEKRYQNYPSKQVLRYLILLNSEFGLNQYITIVDKLNSIPKDDNMTGGCTAAISFVGKSTLLPLLVLLIKMRFRKDFKDNNFYTLFESLLKALELCSLSDFDTTVKTLTCLCDEMRENLECVGFCNRVLSDIWARRHRENDGALSVHQVKKILVDLT